MKAQGLPLNTIVLGALAVLVLVLLAAAFVPSIGNMFKNMFAISGGSGSFAEQCQLACQSMDYKYVSTSGTGVVTSGQYCTMEDSDGYHCNYRSGEEGVGVECTIHSTDSKIITISTTNNNDAGCGTPEWE